MLCSYTLYTVPFRDMHVLKQSDVIRFVFPQAAFCLFYVLFFMFVCCIYMRGPVFGLWAAMPQGSKNVPDEALQIFVS